MAVENELSPAALFGRLNEAASRAMTEAPRGQRLAELARGLGQTEREALDELAQATGLPQAGDLLIEEAARPLLPARLAADFQVVPLKVDDAAENAYSP